MATKGIRPGNQLDPYVYDEAQSDQIQREEDPDNFDPSLDVRPDGEWLTLTIPLGSGQEPPPRPEPLITSVTVGGEPV